MILSAEKLLETNVDKCYKSAAYEQGDRTRQSKHSLTLFFFHINKINTPMK
jgi:hypothetical protein